MSIADLTASIEANQRLASGAGNPQAYFGAVALRLLRQSEGTVSPRLAEAVGHSYLAAYDAYQAGAQDVVSVWRVAFDSAAVESWRESLLIRQHLMLGLHAHVGFDLPAAAVGLCQSTEDLAAMKGDFAAYSKLAVEVYQQACEAVARHSPVADTLDLYGHAALGFDTTALRKLAWRVAGVALRGLRPQPLVLQDYNRLLTEMARRLREPGPAAQPHIDFVRKFEPGDSEGSVGQVIDALTAALADASA